MAAYNFRKEFSGKVRNGRKRCTIRAKRKNGYLPRPGEQIDLYTGMRSKGCKKLRTVKVKSVRPITIVCDHERTHIAIDGLSLSWPEIRQLARADGFSSVAEFRGFFEEMHGTQAHLYLIEW